MLILRTCDLVMIKISTLRDKYCKKEKEYDYSLLGVAIIN
jgi:hypothetical protein